MAAEIRRGHAGLLAVAVITACSTRQVPVVEQSIPVDRPPTYVRSCTGHLIIPPADTVLGVRDVPTGTFRPLPTARGPVYPDDTRKEGLDGHVLVSFNVDTAGNVVQSSTMIERETDKRFGDSVCEFMTRLRFTPLELNGRRYSVRVVRQPFTFTLRR